MRPRIPLLLTSSIIAHDNGVKLKNTDARLEHTVEGIAHWLKLDPSLSIVICDGSDYDLQNQLTKEFPNTLIECLHFENDQELVRAFGRGYGEGEIIRYALQNSKLINESGNFMKCSSKLWVEKFRACSAYWNGEFLCKGVFSNVFTILKKTKFDYIDTRFYFCSKSFYEKYLLEVHRSINAEAGRSLEECFHEAICTARMEKFLLPVAPVIQGVGGGTGAYYRNPLKRKLKEKLRLLLVRKNAEYARLFADGTSVITASVPYQSQATRDLNL